MTFGYYKNNIINLGFEESDAFEENPKHIIEATNRAIIYISSIENEKKFYKINPDDYESEEDYIKIDMSELPLFDSIDISRAPTVKGENIHDYYYEGNFLYVSTKYKDGFTVHYNKKNNLIPNNCDNGYNIEIKEELIPMLQLLTAYYIWLDDDERKAVMYYNQFETMLSLYKAKKHEEDKKVTSKIIGGIAI